jgi:hypothetical protein
MAMAPHERQRNPVIGEKFLACVAWRAANAEQGPQNWPLLTLSLSNGLSYSGFAAAVEGSAWVLDLVGAEREQPPTERLWVDELQVVSLSLENFSIWHERLMPTPAREEAPESVLGLRRRMAQKYPSWTLEFSWPQNGADPESLRSAWQMAEAVCEALSGLSNDPIQSAEIQRQVQKILICAGQGGRFRLDHGVLEAGFVSGEEAPPASELQSLLAVIL